MRPVIGIIRIGGKNCNAMVTPSAVALWFVRCVRASQSWAVDCIHVPVFDRRAPPHERR